MEHLGGFRSQESGFETLLANSIDDLLDGARWLVGGGLESTKGDGTYYGTACKKIKR